jgi:quinol monooxygenase YgiN
VTGTSTPIELHLRIRLRPNLREAFLAFLHEAVPFYEGPGGIRIRLLENPSDQDRFIEVVEYADQATCDRDQVRVAQDPHMQSYLARWRALLAEPPTLEWYRVVTVSQHPRQTPGL